MNTLTINEKFFREHAPKGGFCIDATAGNGHDTAALCALVGESGRVLAFDVQLQAVENTKERLAKLGFSDIGEVVLDSHSNMASYAEPGTADLIVFNLGWLPGGDHSVYTHVDTTIAAINAALELLKDGGAISISIYYGGRNGYEERDAVLSYLETVDNTRFTVLKTEFFNRTGNVPISVFILKTT